MVSTENRDEIFYIPSDKAVYKARNVVVATGFYDIPVSLDVPGEKLKNVSHYYKEAHFYFMQKVIVVGEPVIPQ